MCVLLKVSDVPLRREADDRRNRIRQELRVAVSGFAREAFSRERFAGEAANPARYE